MRLAEQRTSCVIHNEDLFYRIPIMLQKKEQQRPETRQKVGEEWQGHRRLGENRALALTGPKEVQTFAGTL